jgi:hypothetical protein
LQHPLATSSILAAHFKFGRQRRLATGLGGNPLWRRFGKKLAGEAMGLGILFFRGGSGVIAHWSKRMGFWPSLRRWRPMAGASRLGQAVVGGLAPQALVGRGSAGGLKKDQNNPVQSKAAIDKLLTYIAFQISAG